MSVTDHQDVLQRYLDGESAAALAAEIGVTRDAIYSLRRHSGERPRRVPTTVICDICGRERTYQHAGAARTATANHRRWHDAADTTARPEPELPRPLRKGRWVRVGMTRVWKETR